MRLSALLVLTCILVTWPVPADACNCPAGSRDLMTNLREARDGADAIFLGRVVSVARSGGILGIFGRGFGEAAFDVIERFKGPVGSKLMLPSNTGSSREFTSCEFPYEPGREYLVYAFEDEGRLVTIPCSRTRSISRNDVELEWLRTGRPPPVPVALQRETVRCQTCDLETVTSTLVGLPSGNARNLGLLASEAAITLWEGPPFWTGGYYNHDNPSRTTAVGLSRELRPFELIQTGPSGTDEKCRKRVSLRWCERLEASSDPQARPELQCVNPGPEQELCDETKSRTSSWEPKEHIQAAQCSWDSPDNTHCNLQKDLQPLAEDAPASPLLRCSPGKWSDTRHQCQVLTGGSAP